ncbi:MAG: hypothetical protein VZQ61_03785 [Christensenellaceae bacterium]
MRDAFWVRLSGRTFLFILVKVKLFMITKAEYKILRDFLKGKNIKIDGHEKEYDHLVKNDYLRIIPFVEGVDRYQESETTRIVFEEYKREKRKFYISIITLAFTAITIILSIINLLHK